MRETPNVDQVRLLRGVRRAARHVRGPAIQVRGRLVIMLSRRTGTHQGQRRVGRAIGYRFAEVELIRLVSRRLLFSGLAIYLRVVRICVVAVFPKRRSLTRLQPRSFRLRMKPEDGFRAARVPVTH